jgi:hypothetical protein
MGKIVYHATHSDEAPHAYGEPFHAGTLNAAYDRLEDEQSNGMLAEMMLNKEWATSRIHKYEIADNAPTSRGTWADPLDDYRDGPTVVPEYSQKRIYPYKNTREDRGSTSYVIPSDFVGNHVKHLGIQFQHFTNFGDYGHEAAVNAMSIMVGGKPPFKAK